MGYSARYHATSLVAVFLALAIGILIGAEFGGDALTNTRKDLENSLTGNLQDARSRADELNGKLARSDEFASRVYPALVRNRLAGRRIGIVALGDLPGETSARDRGRARADRGAPGRGRRRARAGRPARARRRPGENPLRRHQAQRGHSDRLRHRRRPAAGPRRHPAGSGPRPPLLARQRQLRRPRRRDRRPPAARRDGAGAALPRPLSSKRPW